MKCSDGTAEFYGTLDIKTLGGAGFASQRTTGDEREWNLSSYDGVEVRISQADEKQYTFILKDSLLPPDPANGREQSTISYEYDFTIPPGSLQDKATVIFIPWEDLKATYRGKEKDDAPQLDRKKVKRVSLMMRRFVFPALSPPDPKPNHPSHTHPPASLARRTAISR